MDTSDEGKAAKNEGMGLALDAAAEWREEAYSVIQLPRSWQLNLSRPRMW